MCVCVSGEGGGSRAYLASSSQLGMNKYPNSTCLIFRDRATYFILVWLERDIVGLKEGLMVIFCVSVACYRNFAVHWLIAAHYNLMLKPRFSLDSNLTTPFKSSCCQC